MPAAWRRTGSTTNKWDTRTHTQDSDWSRQPRADRTHRLTSSNWPRLPFKMFLVFTAPDSQPCPVHPRRPATAEIARVECGELTKAERPLRRSRSFKATDFGTNRKPACDFLLVNNANLHNSDGAITYRFLIRMIQLWCRTRLL